MKNNEKVTSQSDKRGLLLIIAATLVACIVMGVVDAVIRPGYIAKSLVKATLFIGLPLICRIINKDISPFSYLRPNLRGILLSLALGVAVLAIILGSYFALRGIFDFSGVTKSLESNVGVTKDNFLFVAAYISLINSFLEEFFFRGFAFLTLCRFVSCQAAYIFSSAAFTLYHIAIMISWFSPAVFELIMIGLFAGAVIFNYIDQKNGSIYSSWLIHMGANFAINTIGYILFTTS